ncbi:MAG: SLC13 family permease, partial [Cyanobacteria bacterium J06635_11]
MSIALTLGVTIVALVLFIVEIFPADITALSVMVALILLGQVTLEEGIAGFSNPATITVMAMFILSAGIARTGVLQNA